nr:lysosomal Pro-X carboxypeptidase [Tanacetum cinerariifolium]
KLDSIDEFSYLLESMYTYLAMANDPYPSDIDMPLHAYPIKEVCKAIDDAPDETSILDHILKEVLGIKKAGQGIQIAQERLNVEDISSKAMVAHDVEGFDWSYMADDDVPTNMALMAFSDSEGNKVTSDAGNQGINVVKSSACWVWRPKIKVQDHVSKNSGSYICKRFDYVDPEGILNESDNHERTNAESSTKTVNTTKPVNTATPTYADYPNDPLMPDLEDAEIFNNAYDDRDEGVEADYNKLETIISVSHIPSTRIHKDHPKEHIIGEVKSAV